MAFYIELFKTTEENEHYIYYNYQFSLPTETYKNKAGKERRKLKLVSGKLMIDRKNGDIHTLVLAEGDSGLYAQRAAWALIKCWKKGVFPEKTCWAS